MLADVAKSLLNDPIHHQRCSRGRLLDQAIVELPPHAAVRLQGLELQAERRREAIKLELGRNQLEQQASQPADCQLHGLLDLAALPLVLLPFEVLNERGSRAYRPTNPYGTPAPRIRAVTPLRTPASLRSGSSANSPVS